MKFKVTKRQYEAIKFKAETNGYRFVSDYLRDLALNYRTNYGRMIESIYNKVVKDDKET